MDAAGAVGRGLMPTAADEAEDAYAHANAERRRQRDGVDAGDAAVVTSTTVGTPDHGLSQETSSSSSTSSSGGGGGGEEVPALVRFREDVSQGPQRFMDTMREHLYLAAGGTFEGGSSARRDAAEASRRS